MTFFFIFTLHILDKKGQAPGYNFRKKLIYLFIKYATAYKIK